MPSDRATGSTLVIGISKTSWLVAASLWATSPCDCGASGLEPNTQSLEATAREYGEPGRIMSDKLLSYRVASRGVILDTVFSSDLEKLIWQNRGLYE